MNQAPLKFLHKIWILPARPTAFLVFVLGLSIASQLGCSRFRREHSASDLPPPQPELVDQIFDRYTAAVGGRAAIDRIKSYKTRGSFGTSARPDVGTFEAWAKDPNKTLILLNFPQLGVLKKGFDGETRWVQTPVGTFTDESATAMSEMERDAEVYGAGAIKGLYQDVRLDGRARLSGRDMYVLEGRPVRGPSEKLFFDVENGLLVRWDMVRRTPKRGNVFVKVHLEDYREVDGLKVPFRVRFAFESFDFILKVDELQHNVPIDDAMFKKPESKSEVTTYNSTRR
jgi:hypothetical protein